MKHPEFDVRHIKVEVSVPLWAMTVGAVVRIVHPILVRKVWEWMTPGGSAQSTKSQGPGKGTGKGVEIAVPS